ncbi:MAG: filamentous hemagglutinin N-terminal domain-containing protein, partial [Gammaproteobacteria bacterium]|nr:filamentous hemagglutinin N-terminal domain-containing protein [Gammaproteobacteria bacterium]
MASRILLVVLLMPLVSPADVVLDGSTGGTAGASVSPGNGYTYDITQSLGATRGENLFHSFSEFDIGISEHANFSGNDNIANIVARISSGMESSIEGRVSSTIGAAGLWLINPAGFVFGNGAVVDVNGVFHLTTSEFVTFSDGARFYADLSEDSTLTSAPISQFGFMGGPAVGHVSFTGDPAGSALDSSGQKVTVSSDGITFRSSDIYARAVDIVGGDVTVRNSLVV